MRSEQKQKELYDMTDEQRREKTTLLNYIKTGDIINEYYYWYVVKNRYPHRDRGNKQFVVWLKDNYKMWDIRDYKYMEELREIRRDYWDMNFLNNWDKYKSVKFREHRHLFNEKQ